MDSLEILAAEIESVVRCPYVPCLKRLHDICTREDCPVEDWAYLHHCAINGLAGVVLQGLELFPYTLDILTRFARIPSFRDAVLQQQPLLLDTLLRTASESESKFEKYASSCVSMLSFPIEVALPASYPKFLSKLLENVAQRLSFQTIEPVYKLISTLGASHVEQLPSDLHDQLQETLVNALKTLDLEEHSTNLLNLATLAYISSRSTSVRSGPRARHSSEKSAELDGIGANDSIASASSRQFFYSKKAHKVLDLVTLKAILISSVSTNLKEDQIVQNLGLCSDIVSAVSIDERAAWHEKSSGKVRKLYDRLLRQDLTERIRAAILEFWLSLTDERNLPANFSDIVSGLLTNIYHPIKASFIEKSLICLEPMMIGNILLQTLENVNSGGHMILTHIRQLEHAHILLKIIDRRSELLTDVSKAVMDATCGEKGQQLLSMFLASMNSSQKLCTSMDVNLCCCNVRRLELNVRSSLALLLLKCTMRHMSPNNESLPKLLDWFAKRKWDDEDAPCGWQGQRQKAYPSAVSLFEAGSTPRTSSVSQGWRDRLIRDMSRDARNRSESVIRLLGEVCRDLEARCDETEAPLRREKERVVDLESQLADAETCSFDLRTELETRITDLVNEKTTLSDQAEKSAQCFEETSILLEETRAELKQARDDAEIRFLGLHTELETKITTIRNLESEKLSLSDQAHHSAQRLSEISVFLEETRAQLKQARDDTENRTAILTERYRQQDLTYLAILTGKDEKYDEQAKTLSASRERTNALEIELQQSKDQMNKLIQNADANANLIESQQKVIDELKNTSEQEAKTTEDLVKTKNELLTTNKELQTNMTESLSAKDFALTELSERLRVAETTNIHLTEKHSRATTDMEAALSELRQERQIKIEACHKINEHEKAIASQQAELLALRQERDARLREFAEAQDLSSRLIAIVGMKRPAPSLSPSSPRSGSSQRHSASMTSAKPDSATTPYTVKNTKAKRPRNQATVISPFQSVRGERSLALKEKRRLPLTEKEAAAINALSPKRVTKQVHDVEMELSEGFDGSFNDSDIFTSTEQNQLTEANREKRSNAWDETTVDS